MQEFIANKLVELGIADTRQKAAATAQTILIITSIILVGISLHIMFNGNEREIPPEKYYDPLRVGEDNI